ncbi:TPA: cytochrome c biogenesis protein CcdA [Candidatus Woesearchaeota archaeon]|nr:cytochrome c biogenesis protein CcdA [Candidatus Woesearchaeota archaeon]HIJ01896.1 cytochrome c biogenesis protein CcdA [Candidatus Woesearchaeota archaeon]HIJ13777.1 cytochrome c biogenesis protein CcdA [Candidatus Woesearchaeota archaeon]
MNILFLSIISYVAGIVTFLAPCTLPILPVYLSMCMKNDFRSLTRHTIYLGLGIAIVYIALGVFAGSIGGFITENKLIFMRVVGVLLILIGIAILSGISFIHQLPQQKKFTPLATILYGVLFGLAWSGCIGPVLGGVLVIASATGTVIQGGFLLLMYAMGMITPLIIISIIADRTEKIPKLWRFLYGKLIIIRIGKKECYLHTTNIIASAIFILLGIFFLLNGTEWLTRSFPNIINWVFNIEEKLQLIVIK